MAPPTFFLDHNVAKPVGDYLAQEGFQVTFLKDVLMENTEDPVVAAYCIEKRDILITHDSDFKSMRKRLLVGNRFRALNCVVLACAPAIALARLQFALPHIQFVWEQIEAGNHVPLKMHVQTNACKIIDE